MDKKKTKKTSKTEKTKKYYYSRASIIRSAVCTLVSLALFITFFVCFMTYGGEDRSGKADYKSVSKTEKNALSMIDGIAADGKGRVYVFYSRTFDINAYDETGKFLESYTLPKGEEGNSRGGIVCRDGKLYAFNNSGDVFVYGDGKYIETLDKEKDSQKCKEVYNSFEYEKDLVKTENGEFKNNYLGVTKDGKTIISVFFTGLLFSPFSMVMAIIMTLVTYLCVRRYNKKVRCQKIRTFFKKNIAVK